MSTVAVTILGESVALPAGTTVQQAIAQYREAAELGLDVAQNTIGNYYRTGNGVAQDYAAAVSWYEKAAEQDWTDKLTYLAKTKGYLLGWLLIVWGGMDLLGLLATTMMVGGFFNIMSLPITATINGLPFTGPAGMMTQILWLPALYGAAKIALGVFVLRRGREYAEKVKEEEER